MSCLRCKRVRLLTKFLQVSKVVVLGACLDAMLHGLQHHYYITINHEKIGLDIVIYDTNVLRRQIHRFGFVASAEEANPKWCLKWCRYTVCLARVDSVPMKAPVTLRT